MTQLFAEKIGKNETFILVSWRSSHLTKWHNKL